MSTPLLPKELHVQTFLQEFNLSNQKQTKIKRLIIQSIQELVDKRIIKPSFKIIRNVQNNLTSQLITKSKLSN